MAFQTVKDIRDFSKWRKILILKGKYKGEEADYVDMVWNTGKIPSDAATPTKDLRMRVKLESGQEIDLIAGHFMWIEKKIIQDGANN